VETRIGNIASAPASHWRPEAKAELFDGRREASLGKAVGLKQFGVNYLTLQPGGASSLRHWHEGEDEFVLALSGELTLIDENGEHLLAQGSFAGFPSASPNAHHLVNKSNAPATCIVVGTRKVGLERVHYPDDDGAIVTVRRDANGVRIS
jgi:uncharacterized cupin superfamily protein